MCHQFCSVLVSCASRNYVILADFAARSTEEEMRVAGAEPQRDELLGGSK
jgi:hypothetical protein